MGANVCQLNFADELEAPADRDVSVGGGCGLARPARLPEEMAFWHWTSGLRSHRSWC